MTEAGLQEEISFKVRVASGGIVGGLLGTSQIECTVRGSLYRPSSAPDCNNSVLLLLHGISQGRYAWDFPMQPDLYSPARILAGAGYPVVAIDRLGYKLSEKPNGRGLTVQAHADVTAQIVAALRSGNYAAIRRTAFRHVGLVGHSLGTEIAELYAGQRGAEIDLLIATAWTHGASPGLLSILPGETVRALASSYFYFGGTPENRERLFYDRRYADPAIVAKDTELAGLSPSGEALTTLVRQSMLARAGVTVPVLLVLAEEDRLFPAYEGDLELAGFASAHDRSLMRVERSGHVLFLHPPPAGSAVVERIIGWLRDHPMELPAC